MGGFWKRWFVGGETNETVGEYLDRKLVEHAERTLGKVVRE